MYTGILHLHDFLRWLLLLSLLITLGKYFIGWTGQKVWTKTDNVLGIIFTSLFDLQLLTGIILYFISPVTKMALSDFGSAMKDSALRFYAVEHLTLMIIAAVLIHIGRAKSKKKQNDTDKFKISFAFFAIALVLIIIGIPWDRI